MNNLSTWLNVVGLCLDILGAVVLYNTRFKGIGKVARYMVSDLTSFKVFENKEDVGKGMTLELLRLINENIESTNRENDLAHARSRKWFALIVIGFALQLTAAILQGSWC